MIRQTSVHECRNCGSSNIVKNGTNKSGSPQYHCKSCGVYRVLTPQQRYSTAQKTTILKATQERISLRGLQRVFGVHRQTVSRWLVEQVRQLPVLVDTLLPPQAQDVLELDEVWTFVGNKTTGERWLWTALCRRTRQIVAFFIGSHDKLACQQLWQRIPQAYAACATRSDAWRAYAAVLPAQQHLTVDKASGETAHQERWYNTLRQRLARFVRKTLSFSKSDTMLYWWTLAFILEHNQLMASLTL
jgi:IS1 family transposase/transposase-like protein